MKLHRTALVLTIVNLALLLFTIFQMRQATAPDAAPVLRTQAIELVDAAGQVRARLNMEDGGEVVFRLLDQDGAVRIKLGAGRDGSGLVLNNDVTEPGAQILATSEGSSLTSAQQGRHRTEIRALASLRPAVSVLREAHPQLHIIVTVCTTAQESWYAAYIGLPARAQ